LLPKAGGTASSHSERTMAHSPVGSWPEVERRSGGERRVGFDRRGGPDRRTLADRRTWERRQIRSSPVFVEGYPDRRSDIARRSSADRRISDRRVLPDRRPRPILP
jgi:hypothetical protein